jgi:F-type H+-transporting ATPase subunit gamma
MASLSEYKQRIASTSSLQKIFKAQELISTSRIKKARENALLTLPYSEAIESALKCVISKNPNLHHSFIKNRKSGPSATDAAENSPSLGRGGSEADGVVNQTGVGPSAGSLSDAVIGASSINDSGTGKIAIVVLSSDRGMAGSFNSAIIRKTEKLIAENPKKDISIYTVGGRSKTYFTNHYNCVIESFVESSENPSYEFSKSISRKISSDYLSLEHNYDEVYLLYTKFKNMVSQIPTIVQLLPLSLDKTHSDGSSFANSATGPSKELTSLYEFVPSVDQLLDTLIPRYITTTIFHLLLESAASETAARQRAMHTANDNANDLLEELVRKSNSVRQANITNELNEMASAAESLKG